MAHSPLNQSLAEEVLQAFEALPQKCRPLPTQWTILAGIILTLENGEIECVSIGTGVKCIPQEKVPLAKGLVLHDQHAEILALRAFNAFLLSQAQLLAKSPGTGNAYLVPREITQDSPQPFALRPGIKIHLFTTTTPCGDASMNQQIARAEDSTPWEIPSGSTSPSPTLQSQSSTELPATPTAEASTIPGLPTTLRGRGYFTIVGVVRTKPGRADSPMSMSKSCSDKIAAKQLLSLLSTPVSAVVHPAGVYLSSMIVPREEFCDVGFERAFRGRMAAATDWSGPAGYAFHGFDFGIADVTIPFAREKGKASAPVSAVWVKGHATEAIIGGVRAGRKPFLGVNESSVCRRVLWEGAWKCLEEVREGSGAGLLGVYEDVKKDVSGGARWHAKEITRTVLKPWGRNGGNDIVLEKPASDEGQIAG